LASDRANLERALHLREELGARDERSAALSARAGELFATAGAQAFAALDYITSRDLRSEHEAERRPEHPSGDRDRDRVVADGPA
jgi:hypothetical protein